MLFFFVIFQIIKDIDSGSISSPIFVKEENLIMSSSGQGDSLPPSNFLSTPRNEKRSQKDPNFNLLSPPAKKIVNGSCWQLNYPYARFFGSMGEFLCEKKDGKIVFRGGYPFDDNIAKEPNLDMFKILKHG